MAYLPDGTPSPQPGPDDRPFWDACARRELRIQRCSDCGRFRHPPMPRCPSCRSDAIEWAEVPGTGSVYSYTIVRHPVHPALVDAVPYNVVVVMLDGADDVRLVSNLLDVAPEDVAIGMRVALAWDDTPAGPLPRFRRAAPTEGAR
ncbi:MAG TPA: OB-fold domain-containing protein [Burkholderiaceae bacterium]|nr:OB-fold domain-containing protein [Burkholderiaceae bacterium]